jgi:glycosyltransferase involved in cell wall biosynthesis
MTNDVVVSVITPVRDGDRFMAACIEAVALQHPAPFEHIVVDDGSSARTP